MKYSDFSKSSKRMISIFIITSLFSYVIYLVSNLTDWLQFAGMWSFLIPPILMISALILLIVTLVTELHRYQESKQACGNVGNNTHIDTKIN